MDKWEKIDQYGYILTKYNTIVTELIYFWTLSENRLNIVPGKKKVDLELQPTLLKSIRFCFMNVR